MQYTSIEQMLQMSRGGTVSGRAPTVIQDQVLDAKSGDGPQIEMAKQSLYEAMQQATARETPEQPRPTALTEQELTELSTGQVDRVLAAVRRKLIKRAKEGRNGSMKNIADYARREIMNLGEAATPMAPALASRPPVQGERPPREVGRAEQQIVAAKQAGPTGETTQGQRRRVNREVFGIEQFDPDERPFGEANTSPGPLNTPGYGSQKPRTIKSGYTLDEQPLKKGATKQAGAMQHSASMSSRGKNADPIGEATMSDSDTKKAAAAAGERMLDKVWQDYESEEARLKGLAAKTGAIKSPLKEAIAAFQETVDLTSALHEYNTAAGKVTGQKVYSDPVSTMNANAAYRTDLLKLSAGKGKTAGQCGKAKARGVKPGDPIGD